MTDTSAKATILAVDDAPENLDVLKNVLVPDYLMKAAIHGPMALKIAQAHPPDLILLDIMMPEMDGFEVCRRLKAMTSTQDIPVIFLTAYKDTENETLGLALGAVDFISKPINPAVLLARVKTHLTLKKAQKQAMEAILAKGQFLAHVSHEIRTPLNGILGFIDLLAKKPQDAETQRFLAIIQQSGHHLRSVINDLLDYSKMEANRMSLEEIPFDLPPLLAEIPPLFALATEGKAVNLAWRCADDVPTVVLGDPNRLRQVLYNLVSNATKFTQKGRIDLEVERVREAGESVTLHFAVRDTGMGISPDRLQTLFQPFVQADVSTTRTFGGTGLGLFICNRLVQLMGGTIQVESKPGEGSCFHFTATFVRATRPADAATPPSEPPESPIPFRGTPRLLVVDDVETNRIFLSETLPLLGIHSVELANNGQEALERLQERPFDLVLMDCQMPVMNGFDATRALRHRELAEGQGRHTPVIALTAGVTEADRAYSLAAGMDDFLTKPVQSRALLNALKRWLMADPPPIGSEPTPHPEAGEVGAEIPSAAGPLNEAAFAAEYHAMGQARTGRLIHAFFQDLTRNRAALRAAVQTANADGIFKAAHALKGCCGVVHATRMMRQCEEMQAMGKSGAIQGVAERLEQLEKESVLVQAALERKMALDG